MTFAILSNMVNPAHVKPAAKRRAHRFKISDVTVEAPIDAVVCDVSDSGLGVEARDKLLIGVDYIFRLRIRQDSIKLPGRVEWCRLIRTQRTEDGEVVPVYRAGVALAASAAAGVWRIELAKALDSSLELQDSRGPMEAGAKGG